MVADFGADTVKAGYGGEDSPKAVFPSCFGEVEPRAGGGKGASKSKDGDTKMAEANGAAAGAGGRALHVGEAGVNYRRDHMEIKPTVADGVVQDWDAFEGIWSHIFTDKLKIDPEEYPVLLAEAPVNPKEAREKTVEILFEKFNVPAVFLAKSATLSAFSIGRPSALVVDVGHDGTVTSAVHDGYVLQKSVRRGQVGGRFLSECMLKSLEAQKVKVTPRYAFEKVEAKGGGWDVQPVKVPHTSDSYRARMVHDIVADCKEATCRTSETPFDDAANANIPAVTYELPDGQEVQIGADRFKVPEGLFRPPVLESYGVGGGRELPSITSQILDSLSGVDVDVRKELLASIVLTGGSSMFPNLRERLERELLEQAPANAKVKVITSLSSVERRFSTWIGGSILSSLGSFQQMWMSKQEFEEHGAQLIHRKAP